MLLDDLTEEEQALFAEICRGGEYKAGDEVVSEGDEGDSLLFIRKGRAEVRKGLDSSNNYKYLKELQEGDFFGEMSFLSHAPRSATVVAMDTSEILELKSADFDKLVADYPALGLKVYRNIARELALRLKRNNEDLRKAVLWAIEGTEPG